MKIAFINTNLEIGGTERTVEYLANDFADKCDVDVVSIDGTNKLNLSKKVKLHKLNVGTHYNNVFTKIGLTLKRFCKIFEYFLKNKPDIVVCLLCGTVRFIKCFQWIFKYKIISSERTDPSDETLIHEKYLRQSDGVIFQTKKAREYYPNDIQQKSTIIPNAVGNPLIKNIHEPQSRKKSIVAMGRVCEEKDYITLIDAFKIVHDKCPEYRLEIYGDRESEYSKYLHDYVSKSECSENIDIYPASMDALEKVNQCSCYVLSSTSEGMPNALMEAMAIGMPCVSTDCNNGPSELIDNGINGLLVPIKQPDKMADAIIKVISDCEYANNLGTAAKKILKTHSISDISVRYYDYITSFYHN